VCVLVFVFFPTVTRRPGKSVGGQLGAHVEEGALGRTAIEQASKLVKRCGRFSGIRYVGLWPLASYVNAVHGNAKISSEGG
jgi:hypothetical protein